MTVRQKRDFGGLPQFWRNEELPFIEARSIRDGRSVCYAPHTHERFSIGTVVSGRSIYVNGRSRQRIGPGTVVIINPEEVHACNPDQDGCWSYRMYYVDTSWLAELQYELGLSRNADFHAFATKMTADAAPYRQLNRLYDTLCSPVVDLLQKQCEAVAVFAELQQRFAPGRLALQKTPPSLLRAVEYIHAHYGQSLKLQDICAAAGLSPAYLIRSFKQRYGMTPHAYLLNYRIRHGRTQLKDGTPIAEVALNTGFADQAHFQRSFKRFVAATPQQYRRSL